MGDSRFQKIRLLKVYELLKKFSDANNPLSTQNILDKLKLDGIYATRKTIYNDIAELNEFGYQVETSRGRANEYYVVERCFDLTELKILMDAVSTSSFLTASKSESILKKLAELESDAQSKLLLKNCVSIGGNKTENKAIYYYISTIDLAITNKKQMSFLYTEYNEKGERVFRKEGKRYVISPITMFIDGGRYYLACWQNKYNDLSLYRVDRMCDIIELEDMAIIPFDKLELQNMKEKMFSMYLGEEIECSFVIRNSMVDVVVDKFSEQIKFLKVDNEHLKFTAKVFVSPAFISWVVKFGKYIKVVSPTKIVEKVKELVKELNETYL